MRITRSLAWEFPHAVGLVKKKKKKKQLVKTVNVWIEKVMYFKNQYYNTFFPAFLGSILPALFYDSSVIKMEIITFQ